MVFLVLPPALYVVSGRRGLGKWILLGLLDLDGVVGLGALTSC